MIACFAFVSMLAETFSFKDDRASFSHDQHFVLDAVRTRTREQAHRRFIKRLVSQTERSVMHRHQRFCTQLVKRFDCFFRIHVNFAPRRRVVGADRKSATSIS